MRRASCVTLASLLLSALTACGGKSFERGAGDDDAAGSGARAGSAGSSSSAGAGATTSEGGTAGSGGNTSGGAQAGSASGGNAVDACEAFADESGSPIGVQILNKTAEPLYLGDEQSGSCGGAQLVQIAYQDGTALQPAAGCRQSCDRLRTVGAFACPIICAVSSAITLPPGGVYETTFDGLDHVQLDLPSVCLANPGGPTRCDRAARIQPGTFEFSARAGTSLDCPNPDICRDCRANPDGTCTTLGATIGGTLRTAETTLVLNADYGVHPKSAPSPAPGPTPGGAGNAAAPVVQIVFYE